MNINTLGHLLKYYRAKYDLQQETLCSGICSVATLSKVEQGSRIIDSLSAECLLGRIGKEVLQFEIILNEEDYMTWNLREEIRKCEKENNYEKLKELLCCYEKIMPQNEQVHRQFLLFYKAKMKIAEHADTEEIVGLCYDALKCTKPEMDTEEEKKPIYNPTEIELVVYLLRYGYPGWAKRDKEEELLKLLKCIKKVYTGRQREETIILILMNLIEVEYELKDYIRVIKYIDEAIEVISQGRGIEHIAELHFMKAKTLEYLYHRKEDWHIYEKQCRRECLMAYYVFDVLGQKKEIEELQKFCEEELKWQITG